MTLRSLAKGHIFRELYDRPDDLVACFDLLMTRNRIAKCRNSRSLKALARELRSLANQSIGEITHISRRTVHGINRGVPNESPLDLSSTVRSVLIQDTLILIFDIHKALKNQLLPIDIALGTWLLFVCQAAQNTLDTLLAKGFLARGAIGCGTISDSENLILGTAFIDAYDHIEGNQRKPILAIQLTPALLKYQNWINDYLTHIHCSVGEMLHNHVYLAHGGRIFVDPGTRDLETYELRLRLLRTLGCNDEFLFATADFFESSLRLWSDNYGPYEIALAEHAKYRSLVHWRPEEAQEWFEAWRQRNTRCGIGLMHENVAAHKERRRPLRPSRQ
jgi:hypothetical protein